MQKMLISYNNDLNLHRLMINNPYGVSLQAQEEGKIIDDKSHIIRTRLTEKSKFETLGEPILKRHLDRYLMNMIFPMFHIFSKTPKKLQKALQMHSTGTGVDPISTRKTKRKNL